jgi:hypothetical protein
MYGTYCRLNIHVYASGREVIRAASHKLKKTVRFAREHREVRHAFYKQMLNYHRRDRALVQQFRL